MHPRATEHHCKHIHSHLQTHAHIQRDSQKRIWSPWSKSQPACYALCRIVTWLHANVPPRSTQVSVSVLHASLLSKTVEGTETPVKVRADTILLHQIRREKSLHQPRCSDGILNESNLSWVEAQSLRDFTTKLPAIFVGTFMSRLFVHLCICYIAISSIGLRTSWYLWSTGADVLHFYKE